MLTSVGAGKLGEQPEILDVFSQDLLSTLRAEIRQGFDNLSTKLAGESRYSVNPTFEQESLEACDSPAFQKRLNIDLQTLKSTLLVVHQKELSKLKAENQELRERLTGVECGGNGNGEGKHDSVESTAIVMSLDQKVPCVEQATSSQPDASAPEVQVHDSAHELQLRDDSAPDATSIGKPSRASKLKRSWSMLTHPGLGTRKSSKHSNDSVDTSQLGPLERMVASQTFECASASVILANTAVMALRLQYDAIDIGFDLGAGNFGKSAPDTWPHAEEAFFQIDVAFNSIFILEFVFRILALKLRAPFSGWIWFDAIVIAVSCVDTFGSAALPVNPGMLRMLRLVRLVRLFKILKALQACDSLFLLLKAVHASMHAAVWCFGMLASVHVLVGLFLNQVMHTYFAEGAGTDEQKRLVYQYYGTFSGTMLTMFEITMGSWPKPARILVNNVSEWFIIFFIFYRCFFCFAVLKVIAAVFITETNRVLQHDDELTLMKVHREKAIFDRKIKNILHQHNVDERMGWEELKELAYDPEVKPHLMALGMNPHDFEKLFYLMQEKDGKVHTKNFLLRMPSLQGQAKAVDMLTLLKLTHRINQELTGVFQQQGLLEIDQQEEEMERELCGG